MVPHLCGLINGLEMAPCVILLIMFTSQIPTCWSRIADIMKLGILILFAYPIMIMCIILLKRLLSLSILSQWIVGHGSHLHPVLIQPYQPINRSLMDTCLWVYFLRAGCGILSFLTRSPISFGQLCYVCYRRGLVASNLYPMCNLWPETPLHCLHDCIQSKKVWLMIDTSLHPDLFSLS